MEKKIEKSLFQKWNDGDITGFGSFHTTILKAYQIADLENRKRLNAAFPEWFLTKPLLQVRAAKNMMDVSSVLAEGVSNIINQYAKVKPCPPAAAGSQRIWIDEAVTYYKADVLAFKVQVVENIPAHMQNCTMYRTLVDSIR